MRLLAYEQEVHYRVRGRPHLVPVFSVEALRLLDYGPYYVVLNVVRNMEKAQGLHFREWTPVPDGIRPRWNAWYEVHRLTAPVWVHDGIVLPFGPLDARAVPYVLERDRTVSGDEILERVERYNRLRAERLENERRQMARDMAEDLRTAAMLDAWGPSTFGPGRLALTGGRKEATREVLLSASGGQTARRTLYGADCRQLIASGGV